MILKRLILHGFKSFADRTELDFGPGISGIVGPNGCGKSNIVDAVKWVLGSQSAKGLRGTQMMDVVFSGSGTRKPSGLAQVDLVFDNGDGRLPCDQAEVTVTRRLLRSGESEYLLNKQVCRLKDIRELFLDTGIGVDAYSVIEQGRVDSLLRANPVDRRLIFEEAAGISKYKVRKREAQRRLERVNQNLLRLQDILDELERRLRSIKVQAGKARHYQEYTRRLRELRSTYALAEYHRLRESRTESEAAEARLSDRSTALRTGTAEQEAAASAIQVELLELEKRIGELDAESLTVESQAAAQEERIAAGRTRIAEQGELLERCGARVEALERQVAAQRERLAEQEAEERRTEAALAAADAAVAAVQQRDHAAAAELTDSSARLEDEKAGVLELMRRISQVHNDLAALAAQQEARAASAARLEAREREIRVLRTDADQRREALGSRLAEIDRRVAEQQAALESARARSTAVAAQRTQLLDRVAAAKEARSGLLSRRELLEELDRRREGLLAAAREVLARRDADPGGATFGYVRGPIGELFEADAAHAAVVEAALGELQQALVVTSRDALLADRPRLAELPGRLVVCCLDQAPPALDGPDLRTQEGYVASVLDWVRVPEDCSRLARHLLGRTHVVASMEAARRIADALPGPDRFVTLEGEVLEPDGRVALGPPGAASGLISRRSELREIGGRITALETEIAALTAELERTQNEAGHLDAVQQDLRGAIYLANNERVEVQATLASLQEEARKLDAERTLLEQESALLAGQSAEAARKKEEHEAAVARLEGHIARTELTIAELRGRIDALASQRQALAEETTQARVEAGRLLQQRAAVRETIHQSRGGLERLEAEHAAAVEDRVQTEARIEQARRQVAEAQAALEELSRRRTALAAQSAAQRGRRDAARAECDGRQAEARRLRQEVDEAEAELHGVQMRLQEVRVRLDDLSQRVREELDVDLEERYGGYVHAEQDWTAVEAEIADLKEKIERLGNVNLDAIAEQEELEKRYGFLAAQRDDLRASEKQLIELIEKLNAACIERFEATFGRVREHFGALFKKLFGGGKADLFLENPSDPLESGIEIMVRPPGKELQTMSLLSGGEKTMTAIALLLAVFRTRPSPFAILDEVDAALDEANIQRFLHVIEEFVADTQFIIITHSKRTMGVADVLYGITMQEAGVSKRVSVRFEQETGAQSAVA